MVGLTDVSVFATLFSLFHASLTLLGVFKLKGSLGFEPTTFRLIVNALPPCPFKVTRLEVSAEKNKRIIENE